MPLSSSTRSLAELAELLKGYIRRSGKTQRKLAEEAGIPSPTYLSQMANGRVNWIESDYFRPLSDALGLSVNEMAELNPSLIVAQDRVLSEISHPIRSDKVNGSEMGGVSMVTSDTTLPFVTIPVYGLAVAGSPADYCHSEAKNLNIVAHEIIPRAEYRNGNTLAMYATGDSMSPTIEDGELVVADKSLIDLQDGFMYFVCIEGQGVCVKRAMLLAGAWWLDSDNRAHKPFQAEDAVILGQVYWSQPRGKNHVSRGRPS